LRAAASSVGLPLIHVGDVIIDPGAHAVVAAGRPIELTRAEFGLLKLLARHPGQVLTHRALLAGGHAGSPASVESLRVHITHLRKKLGSGERRPQLHTKPGVGYALHLPCTGQT
jgi:DNA-binding response OmpR family regulator